MAAFLRLAVAGVIILLLIRAARPAWRNRALAYAVWRSIRPRHVLGCLGLMVVVATVMLSLLRFVPLTGYGFGTFIGLDGNAVFAPLEEASVRSGGNGLAGPAAPTLDAEPGGLDAGRLLFVAGASTFLIGLLLLLPWLAYVEERTFRAGLERAGPVREVLTALRFGLVHLVMLIPLAAALAVGVAGFAYGRIYRRAHRRASARMEEVEGPLGVPVAVAPSPARVRGEAVLEATIWHTTFNSMIIVIVGVALVLDWLL
jgi:hypothetical protein